MKFKHLIFVALIGLSGCATTPNTTFNTAPGVDFRNYSTFGFFSPLSTDEQGYESMLSSFLKVATAQELDMRGLKYSATPDLLVNFYVNSQEKIRSRTVPTTRAYYAYRTPLGYDPFLAYPAYETHIDQYTIGTLNIDVVDAKTQKLVWEGMVSGRVTDRAIANLEQTIDDAVSAIMIGFPVWSGLGY